MCRRPKFHPAEPANPLSWGLLTERCVLPCPVHRDRTRTSHKVIAKPSQALSLVRRGHSLTSSYVQKQKQHPSSCTAPLVAGLILESLAKLPPKQALSRWQLGRDGMWVEVENPPIRSSGFFVCVRRCTPHFWAPLFRRRHFLGEMTTNCSKIKEIRQEVEALGDKTRFFSSHNIYYDLRM